MLDRADKFELVVFDFKNVESVGQAFADQIFRVYAADHPDIQLSPINMNVEVRRTVNRALAAKDGLGHANMAASDVTQG
ncbi:STAS-like domain-containing protein [Xenophilus aerolatus]